MRVILDECLPKRLTRELLGHDARTVRPEMRGMAGVAGLEPEQTPSPIFAKMRQTCVFIGVFSLFLFFSQFVFAKKNEGFLSLIVPKPTFATGWADDL